MTLYAILSDIHGNYQALLAVERDAQKIADQTSAKLVFVCLGDVVDYGPQPNECMKWVLDHCTYIVQGNHEKDIAGLWERPPQTIDEPLWPITLWTGHVLEKSHKSIIQEWVENREVKFGQQDFKLFHSSLTTLHAYIDEPTMAWEDFRRFRLQNGLFGHTHHQGYFLEGDRNAGEPATLYLTRPDNFTTSYSKDRALATVGEWHSFGDLRRRALFNPGSVGQPRSHSFLLGQNQIAHDGKAAYMLINMNGDKSGEFQFRRVGTEMGYDVEETITLLQKCVRWSNGTDPNGIFKDNANPGRKKLKEKYANMGVLLPEVVEKILIPTLRNG